VYKLARKRGKINIGTRYRGEGEPSEDNL